MREPLPLWVLMPCGALGGAFIGVVGASFYLTWVMGLGFDAFDMLLIARLGAIERELYAAEMRHAYAAIAGMALLGAGLAVAATFKRRLTTYGDAHWQSRAEMKANGLLGGLGRGFVCAKLGEPASGAPYVVAEDRPHVMMIAPTRAGKGVGFVVPNLLTFEGSAVTLDVKGELHRDTARWRAREGRVVHRFAPFDWENPGVRYNPLARVAELPSPEQRYTAVEKLANLFLDRDNRQNDTFSEAGKSIFVAACLRALHLGTPTLGEVRRIVMEGHDKKKQYHRYAVDAADAGDDTARLLWMEASSTSLRLLTSNIQALMTGGFRAWNNPAVRRATDASDFDFATFRAERQSLYLCVAEDDIEALAPLLRMMFGDLIATLRHHEPGKDEPHAVMIMLDEFQQMGAMPYLERAIHTLASYGGRVAIIAQSLASLDRIYGPEGREGFEAGAALKLYIQPRESRTVTEVSRAVGSCTREAVTRSYGTWRGLGGLRGQSVREEERPLLSETEARTMDEGEVIVLAAPLMPIRARRIKHYEDPTFARTMKAQESMPWPGAPKDAPAQGKSEASEARGEKPAAKASQKATASGHGLRITKDTPRETPLPAELIGQVRRLEARIADLTAEVVKLREAREEDRPWWEVDREPAASRPTLPEATRVQTPSAQPAPIEAAQTPGPAQVAEAATAPDQGAPDQKPQAETHEVIGPVRATTLLSIKPKRSGGS